MRYACALILIFVCLGSVTAQPNDRRAANRVLIFDWTNHVIAGYGLAITDSTFLLDTGQVVIIPRRKIEHIELLRLPPASPAFWFGGVLGAQLASSFSQPWGQGIGYITNRKGGLFEAPNTRAYLFLGSYFGVLTASVASLLDVAFRPPQTSNRRFDPSDDGDWRTLERRLSGRKEWPDLRFQLYAGYVFGQTGSELGLYARSAGLEPNNVVAAWSPINGVESGFNAIRRVEATMLIADLAHTGRVALRAGVSWAELSAPAGIWGAGSWDTRDSQLSVSNVVSGYYGIAAVSARMSSGPLQFDVTATVGAGLAQSNLWRHYVRQDFSPHGEETFKGFENATSPFTMLVAGSVSVYTGQNVAIGAYADYAYLPPVRVAELPELLIPEVYVQASTSSVGAIFQFQF